jgi:hypothetical protein
MEITTGMNLIMDNGYNLIDANERKWEPINTISFLSE